MSAKLSVAEVLSNLEARADFHRRREAFRAVSSTALDLARQPLVHRDDAAPRIEIPRSGRLMGSRLIRSVVERWTGGEPFGATAVAQEVNRLFHDHLRRPVDERNTSDVLRRMKREGLLHLVRQGKAFQEALYARGPRLAGA